MKKKTVVIHSGGMDSSICLALAFREYSNKDVLSLSFSYNQRHSPELLQAKKICQDWNVDHVVLDIHCLKEITTNSLVDLKIAIEHIPGQAPNTLVVGRNGLMARLGAIHANHLGAHSIYMGVIGVEGSHSGYRDCSRMYMDLKQEILRLDFQDPSFEIRTPLVHLSKKDTMILASELGILPYLLKETITCYEGVREKGCELCPACKLRNEGIRQFLRDNPNFQMPYLLPEIEADS